MQKPETMTQYDSVVAFCKNLFMKKAKDYGTSWEILRMPSVTDQIGIKADRIRSIQEKQRNLVGDTIESEFVGIINYCIIALILASRNTNSTSSVVNVDALSGIYDQVVAEVRNTLIKKNHDYGEAWRKMRITSMTDLILMKILRIKQIEDNKGRTIASEGIEANYTDIMNYAIFCLILMTENGESEVAGG